MWIELKLGDDNHAVSHSATYPLPVSEVQRTTMF